MTKKFNLSERFKKSEMTIDKETANKLMNDTALEEDKKVIDEAVNEAVTEEIKSTAVKGVVVGCNKLNLRIEPSTNSSIICVLNNADEVEIDMLVNNSEFYRVTTILGASGYCMKKYITLK